MIRVRVRPRASRESVRGVRSGALVVHLTAPPVEGRANEALSRLLGRVLAVPPSAVQIRQGAGGRDKLLRVDGLEVEEARRRLGAVLAEGRRR